MRPLSSINKIKNDFVHAIIIAAMASTCLTSLIECLNLDWIYAKPIIIIVLFFSVLMYYFLLHNKARKVVISSNAIFVVKKNGDIVRMPGYTFSLAISDILTTALNENEAFMQRWKKAFENEQEERREMIDVNEINKAIPKGYTYILSVNTEIFENDASVLLKDAIECDFLDWLSRFLDDFYGNKDDIIKLDREKISSYLLKNKVLEMISKDFCDRSVFKDINIEKKYSKHIVSICDNKTGIEYNRFELVFPDNTTIDRDDRGVLKINNKYFSINFSINSGLFNGTLPSCYPELILKCKSKDINIYSISVSMTIEFDAKKFVFGNHEAKYKWVDDFAEQFTGHYSLDEYLEKIGFYVTRTMVHILHKEEKKPDINESKSE